MAIKPKINGVAVFFIIFVVIEVLLAGIWFANIVINEPSPSPQTSLDDGKLLDQNKYYEIVNPSINTNDDATKTEIRSPF